MAAQGKNTKNKSLFQRIWKARTAYMFLAPIIIMVLVFCYYPPVSGLIHAFTEWSGTNKAEFNGFQNFSQLFRDRVFLNSIPTMFLLLVPGLIIGMVVPLTMAELIFGVVGKRRQSFYRVAILLPIVAPGVVGLLIWKAIYDPAGGVMTALAHIFGYRSGMPIDWLNSPQLVIFSIIFMGFPWIGGTGVLIYMSGLMSISPEVMEASRLDGAGTMRRIFAIDLPLLSGQIRYFLIFGIIGGLQSYGTQVILTKGGPGYKTMVPGYYMYLNAFTYGYLGYACAIGAVMFVFIMIITMLTFRATGSKRFALPE